MIAQAATSPACAADNARPASVQSLPTICQIVHSLDVGGAELLAVQLAQNAAPQFRPVFVCLDVLGSMAEQVRAKGIPVAVLGRRPGFDVRCVWRLARFLRHEAVDVVQAHQYAPFFYALMARSLYRKPPIIFTEHGRAFPDYARRKRMFVNRLLLEARDRVVGVGSAVRQALVDCEGIPSARIEVVYNGINLAPYRQIPADRASARRDMQVGDQNFVLIQVARLDYLKDHGTAVDTLAELVRYRPNTRLVLVGDGPERPKIEARIAELKLQPYIRLMGQRRDVPRLLAAADAFLLTSISEGIPLSVIEAMAAELPVVATHVGGVAEVVEEDQTGLLAPARNATALAGRVLQLAADSALARRLGERGRMRAFESFSDVLMHRRYLEIYRQLLKGAA